MRLLITTVLVFYSITVFTQTIHFDTAKFTTENDDAFKNIDFDDSQWKSIHTGINWELQGYQGYNGYAWYRIKAVISSSLKNNALWKDSLRIDLGKIDDCDEVYLNGTLISKSGSFPNEKDGYISTWSQQQEIRLATNNPLIQWDRKNIIAIKVYDGSGGGGLFGNTAFINMVDIVDGIKITSDLIGNSNLNFEIENIFKDKINGKYIISGSAAIKKNIELTLMPHEKKVILYAFKLLDSAQKIQFNFTEALSKKTVQYTVEVPYILTPKASPLPQINTPVEYGVGINRPVVYKIPATGNEPLEYNIKNLPNGLQYNASNGIISGTIANEGVYNTIVTVKNKLGTMSKPFVIKCGKGIALTPPMGWNSWNCWGLSVSNEKVRASAQAMIDKKLINYGWSYINIDDGWEASERASDGAILTNNKFPNIKGLSDWLHNNGLKLGIYSSPGPRTCGGFLGSFQHELQDATTYANWGIDYLKYDWCSYTDIHEKTDTTLASYQKPYIIMYDALKQQPRDIVYSLCQYGSREVWKWGASVGGNLWRTSGDIEDTWASLSGIGFSQTKQQAYAKPGAWNDADMMIVGKLGWGENLHSTRLTPDEQYTHVSLWCLLNNPLLIGCDMSKLDDFTLSLLTNSEVIAIDQNTFAAPAKPVIKNEQYQVWVKQMSNKEYAVGIFNLGKETANIKINWEALGLDAVQLVRDVWRQKNEGQYKFEYSTKVPSHGVKLITCTKK